MSAPRILPFAPWLCLAALCLLCIPLDAAEELPRDREATRRDIDARIDKFVKAKRAPTLGLLKETINLSISWGAPAYDDGDRAGCYQFYKATIERLEKEFAANDQAAPEVRAALADLQHALDSAQTYPDIEKQAWALRYGFDKVVLTWSRLNNHQQTLVGLGDKYFQLGLYTQALDACTDAAGELRGLAGAEISDLGLSNRTAPLSCVRACFTLRDWKAAAGWLPATLEFLPDLPTYPLDPKQFYGDIDDHAAALKALELAAAKDSDNADMRLVLAVELFFLDRRDRAKVLFSAALEKDPDNPVATAFLKIYPDSDYQKTMGKVIKQLGAEKRADRMQAWNQLLAAGRWIIPALHQAEKSETNPAIGTQVRELLQRLGEKADTPLPRDQEY